MKNYLFSRSYYRYDINYNIIKALYSLEDIKITENDDSVTIYFKTKKSFEVFKKVKYFFNDFEPYLNILRYFKSELHTNFQWYSYLDFEQRVENLAVLKDRRNIFSEKDLEDFVYYLSRIMKICKSNTRINNFNDFEIYCVKYLYMLFQVKDHYRKKILEIMTYKNNILNISFDVLLENLLSSRVYFKFLNEIKKDDLKKFQYMVSCHNIKNILIHLLKRNPFEYVFKFITAIDKNDFNTIFYLEFFSDNYYTTDKKRKFYVKKERQLSLFNEDVKRICNEDLDVFRKKYKIVKPLSYDAPYFKTYIRELISTKELFKESMDMKHCIRNYSYKWPYHRFFSITFNGERTTLEMIYNKNGYFEIIQHKGYRNSFPSEEHKIMAKKFEKFLNHNEILIEIY